MGKKSNSLSAKIDDYTMAFHNEQTKQEEYEWVEKRIKSKRDYYLVKSDGKGKAKPYFLHCLRIVDYDSDEIDDLFGILESIAIWKQKQYAKT